MSLNIRPAVPDDIPQVHAMMQDLARHHGDDLKISAETLADTIFTRQQARILVAAEAEGLLGYAMLVARPNLVTGGVRHQIEHLFVLEWRRRAGLGRALIAAARQISQEDEAEALMIGTHLLNLGAQKAYRDMGLQEVQYGPRFRVELA